MGGPERNSMKDPLKDAMSDSLNDSFTGPMQDQACRWIARLQSDATDKSDYQEFALWLASSPEHRAAMDAMLELWGDLGAVRYLPELSAASPRRVSRRRWRPVCAWRCCFSPA